MILRSILLACVMWLAEQAGASAQTLRFLAAYADGASAPVAAGLVEIANGSARGMVWSFERVPNSAEGLARLGAGEAEFALVNGHSAWQFYAGAGPFEGAARRDLRSVAALFPYATHILVRRALAPEGNLGELRNLKGLFNIGRRRSDAYVGAEDLFATLGLAPVGGGFTFDPEPEAVEALVRGNVDGMLAAGVVPAAAASQALLRLRSDRLALLGLDEGARQRLDRRLPGVWFPVTVGPETYRALDRSVDVPAVALAVVTRADVPDAAVSVMLDAVFGEQALLRMIHPAAEAISLSTAQRGLAAPLHPAAAGYYAAAGVPVSERLRP